MASSSKTESFPPVLLLHGFLQSSVGWNEICAALAVRGIVSEAADYTVGCADAADPEALCRAVDRSMDELLARSESERAVVVGYSQGGRIALSYASRHPERIAGLLLESAGLGPADEEERRRLEIRDLELARQLTEESLADFVDRWETLDMFATQRDLPEPVAVAQRTDRLSCDPRVQAALIRDAGQHAMPLRDDNLDLLRDLAVPVLYLAGEKDSRYAGLASEAAKAGAITELLHCGHNTHLELPDQFCDSLLMLLETAAGTDARHQRSASVLLEEVDRGDRPH